MKKLLLTRVCLAMLLALLGTSQAMATVTLNSTNFPDNAFRNAVATAAGVSDGGSFNEATLTTLDLPSMGVTGVQSLKGLELLTGLTYLDISGNTSLTTGADITTLHNLVTLKASDCHLRTLAATNVTYSGSTYAGLIIGSGNASIKYIDLSHNVRFYTSGNLKYLTNLETLLLNDCTYYDYWAADPGLAMASLKWVDVSNCPIMDRIFLPNAGNLQHLNASGTAVKGFSQSASTTAPTQHFIALKKNMTSLTYLNLSNCPSLNSFRAIYSTYGISSIDTLIIQNTTLGWSNVGMEAQTGMTYLDLTNCDISTAGPDYIPDFSNLINLKELYYGENPDVANLDLTDHTALTTLDIHSNTGLTSLTLSNCGLPRNDFSLNSASCNALVTVNLNGNIYGSVGDAMSDLSGINSLKNLYLENNSGFNGLDYTMSANDCGGLQGLDLGKNNFKSFKAESLPSSLTTLLLGNSTTLESVEIHNAAGLTSIGTVNGLGASNGLYLLNDPMLTHLDLESISSPLDVTALSNLTDLTYLNLGNTGQAQTSSLGLTSSHTNLDTLILRGNSSFGYSSSIQYLSGLKYLDISNCDIFFRTGGLLDYLTPSNNPNLETVLCSNSRLGTRTEGLDGFTNLKTVDVSNNVTSGTIDMTQFWVNGSPLLETLDISGDSELTSLQLNNDNLPRTNFSLVGAEDCTALQSLYLNGNNYSSVASATSDFNSIPGLAFLYLQNNSGFTGGPLTMGANDCGNLTGIDLGNNGFTSFSAPSLPSTLTALKLGDNPHMTRLEMHNNPGITKMTSDATMSDGSGLYLLGNTALTYMDISGDSTQCNYFQRIGNNFSLQGVPIDTIRGQYNKFYTFRNLTTVPGGQYEVCRRSNYAYSVSDTLPSPRYYYSAFWPTMVARVDSASLEQLPNLKYLDLSHCQLKDSVYLHKNTELRYLDVSHNRTITRYTSSPDKGAGYRASIPAHSTYNHDYPDYKKYLWLVDTVPQYPYRQQAYDQEYYTMDYNDTTGLYILDLMDNDKLEYLDISYTGIEQTALTHCHVSNARFIWIQDLHNLKYFYANYNGMRSMGIGTLNGKHHQEALRSLERLSVIGMRGADVTTMQGSMNFLNNGRCPNLHYVNVSYSDFDSIGVHNPNIDTLIVRGNPLHYIDVQDVPAITYIDARECAFKQRGYDPETHKTVAIPDTLTQRFKWTYYDRVPPVTIDSTRLITMNGARIGGVYTGAITTPYSGLRGIRAHHRPELTTLLVNNSNALTDVYCHFNPKLTKITGFNDLAYPKDSVDLALGYGADADSLNLVWVNDDYSLIELNLSKNVNLEYLHAYNDKALGDSLGTGGMNLIPNSKLICSWVSNSNLKAFTNQAITLDTLWIWQNPELAQLDVTANERLRRFDLHNCMVRNLDVSHNPMLIDFNCCNMDSIDHDTQQPIWPKYTKYGYEFPGAVPTAINEPGKNSIADLNFSSKNLQTVRADNNDLYCMNGLDGNSDLRVLTYAHNHINAIDLNGCDNITTYDCTHNGRGFFEAEYSRWTQRQPDGTDLDTYHLYYLQLDPDAGDEIDQYYDSFLGYKAGYDSIAGISDNNRVRVFHADGFDPDMVDTFTVNASGPHQGTRTSAPRREDIVWGSDTEPDSSKIYGKVAFLDMYNNTDFPNHQYIEYKYYDGRNASTRSQGKTSTFYMVWTAPQDPTDVKEITEDSLTEATVVSERYYDIGGVEHSELIDGVNIVVRQMSDGSTQTIKIVK